MQLYVTKLIRLMDVSMTGEDEGRKVRKKINNALSCLGTLPLKWYMKNTKWQRTETYNHGVATELQNSALQLNMKIKHIS